MATHESLRFHADTDLVFQAAENALRDLRLKVELADLDRNIIQFRSSSRWRTLGGENLTISFLEEMANAVDVRVSTRVNSHGHMLDVPDWGSGRRIAKLVLRRISEYIDPDADGPTELVEPEKDAPHCQACTAAIDSDGMFCEKCGEYRATADSLHTRPMPKRREETEDEFFDSLDLGDLGKKSKTPPVMPKKPAKPPAGKVPATKPPAVMTEMMVVCDCGARLKIKSGSIGKKIRCPKCQLAFVLE